MAEVVNINVAIPIHFDRILRKEAQRRLTSKSTIVREILLRHIQNSEKKSG